MKRVNKLFKKVIWMSLFIILSSTYGYADNKTEDFLYKIENYIYEGYSIKNMSNISTLYKSMPNSDKKQLLKYLDSNYLAQPEDKEKYYNCINLIAFFALFKDKTSINLINKIFPIIKDTTMKAACEIFYICLGIDEENNLKKYLELLKNKQDSIENIMFVSKPSTNKAIIKQMIKNEKKYLYDGEKSEYWYEVMSWLERNEKWVLKDREQYYKLRLNK
jgi:hypothetical protein